jgi:hypothetical protein
VQQFQGIRKDIGYALLGIDITFGKTGLKKFDIPVAENVPYIKS